MTADAARLAAITPGSWDELIALAGELVAERDALQEQIADTYQVLQSAGEWVDIVQDAMEILNRPVLQPEATPEPVRQLRECVVCGEKTTMSNATPAWEALHKHATPEPPTEAEWSERVQGARARARAKGYDDAHDREQGPTHLLMWAQDYLRRGRVDDAGGLIDAALAVIVRPEATPALCRVCGNPRQESGHPECPSSHAEDTPEPNEEEFCGRCFAGVDSDEHHGKCVVTGHAEMGESAPEPGCKCDGAMYRPEQEHPFLVHPDCPRHSTPEPPHLDPEPWLDLVTGKRWSHGYSRRVGWKFDPRPEYVQEREAYGVTE